jgi:alpha-L-fucosidase 2
MRESMLMGAILAAACGPLGAEGLRLDGHLPAYQAGPDASLDLTDEVTLEAWVRADPMSDAGGRILDKSVPGTQEAYMLDTWPGNSLRLITRKGFCTYDARLSADHWTHVAAVYGASRRLMALYLDGREVARQTEGDFPPMTLTTVPLRLGADPDGGNRFLGSILRAAVYRRALDAAELAARAAGGPAPEGVIAEWDLSAALGRVIPAAVGTLALRRGEWAYEYTGELTGQAAPPAQPLSLWYRQPARRWEEALPVGNGRLGAMVFGGVDNERLQLNENSLWDGHAQDTTNPEALAVLPEVRRLVFEGHNEEATQLAGKMMGIPQGVKSYQTLGDLFLELPPAPVAQGFRRELDLDTGVARVTYESGGVRYTREVFASAPARAIVVRLTAGEPGKLTFAARLARGRDAQTRPEGADTLVMSGRVGGQGLAYEARLRALPEGGQVAADGDQLTITGADSATLLLVAATAYKSPTDTSGDPVALCQADLAAAAATPYPDLLAAHLADHQALFRRVDLDLGGAQASARPTDERLEAVKAGATDPQLEALYFQFGRYLLLSCSRPGGLPANLQGLWNPYFEAPWNSDYHFNINVQMNYWPAEVCGLPECHLPFFDYLTDLVPSGERTAQAHYGARGWVVHHLSDIWGFTTPADGVWGVWPVGAAWAAQHVMEHYRFTGDREFLQRTCYPLLAGATRFMLDFLVEAPAGTACPGKLVTCPSHSPENTFRKADGTTSMFTYAATMDLEIAHGLFTDCLEALRALGDPDPAFAAEVSSALSRLAPLQISPRTGRLQEWIEDYDELEPGHRHMSHLYGLHPSNEITLDGTPELAAAVRKSLEFRLSHGGGHTGWSRAWIISFWARLRDPEQAHASMVALLQHSTLPNLFDDHPPFQIDGNFGATAGVAEMLLQSHEDCLRLLPALPAAWPTGHAYGLRARGGFIVDQDWRDGALQSVTLRSLLGNPCRVRLGDKSADITLQAGESVTLNGNLEVQTVETGRWSVERAQQWAAQQPWLVGCNYVTSTAVNDVEMWQAETFDEPTIRRELGWARSLGMNSVRVFLNFVVWQADPEGLKARFDRFLELAAEQGLSVMPVLFDDCAFAGKEPQAGPQDPPVPGVHNSGWVPSPGLKLVRDPVAWAAPQAYVKDMVGAFGEDPRVVAWDLYNEPGNSGLGEASLPLAEATFTWAREMHPTQPLTTGVWEDFASPMSRRLMELSDVVSFHAYDAPEGVQAKLRLCAAGGRPLLCTEWLHRQGGNTVAAILPLLRECGAGAYNWGLVAGRTQTRMPWGSRPGDAMPAVWQHDLLHADGKPYDETEVAAFRSLTGRGA